jgi:hypothetical protein
MEDCASERSRVKYGSGRVGSTGPSRLDAVRKSRVGVLGALLSVLALLGACAPAPPSSPSSYSAFPSNDPVVLGCAEAAGLAASVTLFVTRQGMCVPATALVGVHCYGTSPLLVRGAGTAHPIRYAGGSLALALDGLPADVELLGRNGDTQVYAVPHQPLWLIVRRADIVERWLPLPSQRIPRPTVPAPALGATPTPTLPLPAPSSPAPVAAPSVFFIGDSITDAATPWLLAYLPGWRTGFDAVVGRSSVSGVSIAATLAAGEPPPDVVVVELGTNDADPAAFLVNAHAILASLREVPLVIWQTAHQPAAYTVDVNLAIAQVTASFPNTVVADWDRFVPPEDLVSDGVHPQTVHDDDMARLIVPLLSSWNTVASKAFTTRCPGTPTP